MLELYIFNKESPAKDGLSYWQGSNSEVISNTLTFNHDKFKVSDSKQHLLNELAQELTYIYRENEKLRGYFEELGGISIELELVDNYHHLLCYNSKTNTLILDSKIRNQLMPIYLFAAYYSLARKLKSEDQIFSTMFDFFSGIDFRSIDAVVKFLERDRNGPKNYDAGSHLHDYFTKVYEQVTTLEGDHHDPLTGKLGNISKLSDMQSDGFLATQLLRNRALVGRLPFDLKTFEAISSRYNDDPFGGEACQEYFESFNASYDKAFAKEYYRHLTSSLKAIGLAVVAQRGSRVAHEQGPILINSGSINVSEDFLVKVRKVRSHTIEAISKIEESANKFFRLSADFDANEGFELNDRVKSLKNKFAGHLLNINLNLDNLLYLCSLQDCPTARFDKALLEFRDNSEDYIETLLKEAHQEKPSSDDYIQFFDSIRNQERNLVNNQLELEELINTTPEQKKVSVLYVQRPSSRSGHFIPRIVMGQNLYIETDSDSEKHRLNAIPYTFVTPDFDIVADGLDSFFENASISIVTDRKTGEPTIKWENAEDLAISLAPGMYRAIKAAQDKGHRFHYQLETTLFGPLIELFLAILENEISNIASIEAILSIAGDVKVEEFISGQINDSKESPLNSQLASIIAGYQSEVMEAADLVFSYYLLEDEVQNYMLQEGLNKQAASFEMVLNLRDVQKDIAKYCLLKRGNPTEFDSFLDFAKHTQSNPSLSFKEKADSISAELDKRIPNAQAKIFAKKYIRYPESTARKEYLEANPNINRVHITSNKKIEDADYYFDLSVAPSRIDFGKHVVASITTMMGRMLGADDADALAKGKEYIDYVSRTQNSLFESSAEVGSAKVIENTCRAIQYSKAIAFQGVFQSFGIDGALARGTINSRDSKAAGIHIMEYGTMASTGYCITKEPLFILLGLAINSETLLDQLGVESEAARGELKNLMQDLLASQKDFNSNLEWQMHIYEELANSTAVQKYLANPDYKWLPNLKSMIALFKYASDSSSPDQAMAQAYSQLASKLIEYSRIINETGIIQRVQLMNSAIRKAQLKVRQANPELEFRDDKGIKDYSDLVIALNASYKGNVSDERENANQYLMALLLHQKQYLKNVSLPEVDKLVEHQIQNYAIPKEIRVYDPLVDPDIFMGGELQARAESTIQKLSTLEFKTPLSQEIIEACVISYGSNLQDWRILNKRLDELEPEARKAIEAKLDELKADIKYLETYSKGFYKDPLLGYQGVDAIQLNSDHDELIELLENPVQLRNIMQTGNPSSLLVLIDNPQQAKRPFLDYDKALEWLALGGTVASHLIAEDKYEEWRLETEKAARWAKLFIQKLIIRKQLSESQQQDNLEFHTIQDRVKDSFEEMKRYADLKRDLVIQKFHEAQEMQVSHKTLKRYSEWIQCLSRISHYQELSEISFNDWLILGGRWVLNGQKRQDIDYIVNLFEKSYELQSLGKRGFELMDLFISADQPLEIEKEDRLIENAGSTKEADLLVSSAGDSLEFRSLQSKQSHATLIRLQEFDSYASSIEGLLNLSDLGRHGDKLINDYIEKLQASKNSDEDNLELNKIFGRLLKVLDQFSHNLSELAPELEDITSIFVKLKEADNLSLIEVFGDHRKHGGVFQKLAAKAVEDSNSDNPLEHVSKLGELFIDCYLIYLTVNVDDENEIINNLATFFDQYLNIHEEDYPPYMYHSLCAGASYGFNQTYYLYPNLRTKMFKLAAKTGMNTYKLLHFLISHKSVLQYSSQEYRDAVIGDYEHGMIAIGYQHETICIEERFWDCMRALRNFVRNYHDKHPLPVVIRSQDATVSKLFRYKLDKDIKLTWIAGVSNIGKHSWDLNCVIRSPLLRDRIIVEPKSGTQYINISVFTPYLSDNGEIKQIYTAFKPEVLEEQQLNYLAPFTKGFEHPLYANEQQQGHNGSYILNEEGFVHALVNLDPEIGDKNELILPKPHITKSAHTHSQYIHNFTAELEVPEVWSMLSMQQMYAKTELPKILDEINMESLTQIDFYLKEFTTKESLAKALDKRLEEKDCKHIDYWLLKASRDSGGRGISGRLSISNDRDEIIDFIFQKTRTDDLVMQEFVPNNARAFINPDFVKKVEDSFIDASISIDRTTPYEQIYFAMRSFQSINGIKGYLFSANIGAVTVNAGQGAKMFYGEPIYIMPPYIATKIQKLLDEEGEIILKEAIPKHAAKYAKANDIPLIDNNIGSNNCYMLNGLFDYIPYIFVTREGKQFKVVCEDNVYGGLDYYYSYYGDKVILSSNRTHKESLDVIQQVIKDSINGDHEGPEELIDIGLAKIEFNSGLGQANLLQKAIEEMAPNNKDLFLEWTEDLGAIGIASQLSATHRHCEEG